MIFLAIQIQIGPKDPYVTCRLICINKYISIHQKKDTRVDRRKLPYRSQTHLGEHPSSYLINRSFLSIRSVTFLIGNQSEFVWIF